VDGVFAVRTVLIADASVLSLVPDVAGKSRIIAGPAPVGTILPFIMLESISKVDRNIPAPGDRRFVTERVQVTVVAENYPKQKQVLRAVRKAAADRINPAITGISAVTIHTDSAGPDFHDDDYAGWRGSQDFRVRFLEER
jgi:cellulose synthase/poly-beta-1,6-N-acetylglucosamine synthase-like glycosyltransferase